MLIFIDESGDTGRKITSGSSRYFVISMVVFDDPEEANRCDREIDSLRKKLKKGLQFEFHFADNSDKVKLAFLELINRFQFLFFSVVIDKDPKKLWGEGFEDKESFYKYACHMALTNANQYLNNAIVVIDKSGNPIFRRSLEKYLKRRINTGENTLIKKVKQQNSKSNNLLQLTDYTAGIIARIENKGKHAQVFYKYIRAKQFSLQKWPK